MKKILVMLLLVTMTLFALSSCELPDFLVKDFTVTFDSDGGSAVEPQTVKEGEAAVKPEDPTKTGYTFAGWYAGETAYDFAAPVEADITLTAAWTENTYTVTFDTDGGSAVASATVKEGATVAKPADPTKEGYTFAGWFVGESAYDFATAVTANVTVKASWTLNTYTVTFNADNGSEATTATVNHGSAVAVPAEPTKTGFEFAGWFVGDTAYDFTAAVTSDVTLTAKWATVVLDVVFNADNGTENTAVKVVYGQLATEPEAPVKEGFEFAGWFVGDTAYDFTAAVTTDLTITAKWTQITYDVTFDAANGSQASTVTVNYGATVAVPETPVKLGFKFLGWFVGEAEYDFTAPVKSDFAVTAKWELDLPDLTDIAGTYTGSEYSGVYNFNEYTFVINANGVITISGETQMGTAVKVTVNYVLYDSTAKLLTVNYTASTSVGNMVFTCADGTLTADAGLFGEEFTVYKNYEVTFDSNGANKDKTVTVEHGSTVATYNPTMKGMTLAGWFAEGSETAFDFETPITSDVTLVAKWEDAVYNVVFYGQDGKTVVHTVQVKYNECVPASEIPTTITTVDGYKFNGKWYTSATASGAKDVAKIAVTADEEYYPGLIAPMTDFAGIWKGTDSKSQTFTVVMDAVNQTVAITLVVGDTADELEIAAVKFDGKKFSIRYLRDTDTSDQLLTLTCKDDGTITASNNLVLKLQYEVTFNSDGGSEVAPMTVSKGDLIVKAEDPTKEGFTFAGWFLNGVEFDFDTTTVTGPVTLDAQWATTSYTVTFNADNGTEATTATVAHGSAVEAPAAPEKEGFIFAGWYNGENAYDFEAAVVGNVDLIAKWIKAVTVTFDSNGGSEVAAQTIAQGTTITAPIPTMENKIFLGWYNGENAFDFTAPITADVSLTAQWKDAVYYTVKFIYVNPSSGAETDKGSFEVFGGELFDISKKPVGPEPSGYDFLGWYNGDTLFDFETTPITSDITLVTKYKGEDRTVTFYNQDKTVLKTVIVENGKTVPADQIPTPTMTEGYIFNNQWVKSYTITAAPQNPTETVITNNTTKFYPAAIKITEISKLAGTYVGEGSSYSATNNYKIEIIVNDDNTVKAIITIDGTEEYTAGSVQCDGTKIVIKWFVTGSTTAKTLNCTYDTGDLVATSTPKGTYVKQA